MNWTGFLILIVFAYLLGSIPTAYLAARWSKGIDIRHYGSGTVSGSMVYEHVHRWMVVPVGIIDLAKSALPTYLGLQLGYGELGAVAAGLAAMAGHNWPIYLGFTGGRGISTVLGMLFVLFPWGDIWLLTFLATGFLFGDSAPWALAGISSLPILIWLLNGSTNLYWLVGGILLLTLLKRLEANRRPLPAPGKERGRIIWLRLLFDRDIVEHDSWIHRRF